MIGRTLSSYRVVEKLGAGGMGEVYLARDERLGRDVALKILPDGRLRDEVARSRFRREAQALLRLSHPHVATLFDFGSVDGTDFLVMERVGGKTLDVVLREGPLPEKEVLRLGAQLARGLAAAHEAGVVHRDLKPSNLALTKDGLLKVLDFGLAQLQAEPVDGGRTQDTPTETGAGVVLGSPPYMSPEQLLERTVDARSDIYSAGACLFELATGKRPFGERSGPSLVEAILHETPEPASRSRAGVSPGLEAVLAKAMDKEPSLRHQTAKDLLADLERLAAGKAPTAVNGGRERGGGGRATRRWLLRGLVAVLSIAALWAAAAWLLRPLPPPRVSEVRALGLDIGWLSTTGTATTWATDGLRVYYVDRRDGRHRLFQAPLAGGEASEIAVPDSFHSGFEIYGFLPRSSSVLCLTLAGTTRPAGWPAWAIPVPSGPARRLGDLAGSTAAVSADGTRLALAQFWAGKLILADDDGSVIRTIDTLPIRAAWPTWSPDGKRLRFDAVGPAGRESERWLWEVPAAGGTPVALWPGERGAWTPDGRLFVLQRRDAARRSDLFVAPDPPPLWGSAEPRRLTSGPLSFLAPGPRPDGEGLLALGHEPRGEIRRYDPATRRFEPFLGGASIGYVDPSPDGQWLAWVTYPGEQLWRGRRDGRERIPLAGASVRAWMPRWSPDGRLVAFIGQAEGEPARSLYVVPASSGTAQRLVPAEGESLWDACWLPDGSIVFYGSAPDRPLRRVDVKTGVVSALPGSEGLRHPKCGRQGQILAMRHGLPPTAFVGRAEPNDWKEIGPSRGSYHSWTKDGRSFCSVLADRIDCYLLDEGRYETPYRLDHQPLDWIDGAPWMGLDLDDSPLVTMRVGKADLYALELEAPD